MQLFTDWITQIILFILLGTVLELLLPNNQMKKYVNLILGLLLLLLLSKPILYIFSVDISNIMNQFDQTIVQDDQTYIYTENALLQQKSEIQATQDAYIWNEVISQLKQEANDMLTEKYGQVITDLSLEHDDDKQITKIICTLAESENENDRSPERSGSGTVKQIEIETGEKFERSKNNVEQQKIANSLATLWDVEVNIIELQLEGGTN